MGTLTPWNTEMGAFLVCLAGQPAKSWECDAQGVAAIRTGICDAEQRQVATCMDLKMAH
jgi:hypothetical protein